MSTVLGIDIGSRGAIVEGRLIDALDMPCLNDGPAKAPCYNSFRHLGGDSIETVSASRLRTTQTF